MADRLNVLFLTSACPRRRDAGVDMVHVRRARALAGRAAVVVVSPTPWVPARLARRHPRWAGYAATPTQARLEGVRVLYPRYVQVPGMGPWAGVAMAFGAWRLVERFRRHRRCDVLFAQSILPDGLAAVLLGQALGVPVACLGRGTDVNVTALGSRLGRALAGWTLGRAAGVGVVAHDLAARIAHLAEGRTPTVLASGVDLDRFVPDDRNAARRALGLPAAGRVVLFAGRLVPGKGLGTLLDAFGRGAPADATLVVVGDGPLRPTLAAAAGAAGLAARVRFAGEVAYAAVPRWLQAADLIVLPSEAEGLPNVVREALACGRPVVATPVGDVPRLIDDDAGRLVPVGDVDALATALRDALGRDWDAARLRARVADLTWERTAEATHRFLLGAAA